MHRHALSPALLTLTLALGLSVGCEGPSTYNTGEIPFEPDRPDPPADAEAQEVEPYRGDNPVVAEAQLRFPTGLDLHRKVIWRTCTPNGGVCHNRKEYPDLHTPANFWAAFSAPCNTQPGEWQSVYDRCERTGDRFSFGNKQHEIGWIDYIPGEFDGEGRIEDDTPGLHIHLGSAVDINDGGQWRDAQFLRAFDDGGSVRNLMYFDLQTQFWPIGDGSHVFARVHNWQTEAIDDLMQSGIVQGDTNRNGTFGAREHGEPVPMLDPGSPESSYLIARMRGVMMGDEDVPGSRMPLANQPLSVSEMLALFCLVEGFPADGDLARLSGAIDYNACSYSDDPEALNLLGEGVTWASRVSKIMEFNCGGCHSGEDPQGGLDLLSGNVYERLLEPSAQNPELKLIEPGDDTKSYLYLKLIGDDSITGRKMPYNPLTGDGELTQAELADIQTWIINGAVENE